jgi:nucleoside-diphosphate-sugar epimerase
MPCGLVVKQNGKFGKTYASRFLIMVKTLNSNVYVLGHAGYIGSHLSSQLLKLGYSVHKLDSRNFNTSKVNFDSRDTIVDCSRVKNFDPRTLQEDCIATRNLIEAVSECNATYVRIGSVLEIDSHTELTPYINWSRQRSEKTIPSTENLKSRLILIPNIYGGIGSPSIIDSLKSAKKRGEEIILENPASKRDFLSMDNFLVAILETLIAMSSATSATTILSSGYLYKVESIQTFLNTQDSGLLQKEGVSYVVSGEIKIISDSLVEYLLDY